MKRIVGLPGETITIRHGDIYTDGQIVRKTLAELRDMAIPVYDDRHRSRIADISPRWRSPDQSPDVASCWRATSGGYELTAAATDKIPAGGWLRYHHRQAPAFAGGQAQDGPVLDDYGYNPGESRMLSLVGDLLLEFRFHGENSATLALWIDDGRTEFTAYFDLPAGKCRLCRSGNHDQFASHVGSYMSVGVAESDKFDWPHNRGGTGDVEFRVELAYVDAQILLAIDERPVLQYAFDPPKCQEHPDGCPLRPSKSPLAISVLNSGQVSISDLRVLRDVYYVAATPAGADTPRADNRSPGKWTLGRRRILLVGR